MTIELTRQDSKAIEDLINRSSMEDFLTTVSMICADKVEPVAIGQQNVTVAKQWSTLADRLGRLAVDARGL